MALIASNDVGVLGLGLLCVCVCVWVGGFVTFFLRDGLWDGLGCFL